ncbi:hypothetical protein ES703_113648 [subsurface metagenome]
MGAEQSWRVVEGMGIKEASSLLSGERKQKWRCGKQANLRRQCL